MDAEIRIRPMQLADVAEVRIIDEMSFSMPWPENSYRFELLQNEVSDLQVVEYWRSDAAHQIIGMIVTWLIVDEAHIATIAVHPDFRNQRIGQKLLAAALQNAFEKGMRWATLEVREHNLPAQALYRHFGFEIMGRRQKYYKDNGEDALIMSVDLNICSSHFENQKLASG